ncbi:MAG: hypothetical protein D6691_03560 [Candidatus Hydrogenedentota bacterium]|nr:MAG: hypothetical protein D6691_03560 [Candidatus Hydrogenedentota bacterium]
MNSSYRSMSVNVILLLLAGVLIGNVSVGAPEKTRKSRVTLKDEQPELSTTHVNGPSVASGKNDKISAQSDGPTSRVATSKDGKTDKVTTSIDVGTPGNFLLARVKDKYLRDPDVMNYKQLMDITEGGVWTDVRDRETLEDMVLQEVLFDIVPTLRKEEHGSLHGTYPSTMEERMYLRVRMREEIEKETTPTREQLEEWTARNISRFTRPERVHAYHLFMQVSKDNPTSSLEAVRQRMEKVKQEADAGTSFAQLARKYSEAASAKVGGEIGWVTRRMPIGAENKPMNIVLENALFALKTGQVSDILQTSHGLHLMYVADRLTTYVPTVDDLITSRILPRSAQVELVAQKWRDLTSATRQRYHAKILFDLNKGTKLTTDVPAVEFNGQKWTVGELEQLYGQRFVSAYRLRQDTTETLVGLLNEVLDEMAQVQLALDRKLDKDTTVARNLKLLHDRVLFKKAFQQYVAQTSPITEKKIRDKYEAEKDRNRLPEATGYIISIKVQPTTVGLDREEARKIAREKAEEIRKQILAGADIEKLAREHSQDDRASSGGLVPRSRLASLHDLSGRRFAAVASTLKPGEVSDVRDFGDVFVVVKLVERWPGEPPAIEEVRERLKAALTNEANRTARDRLINAAAQKGLLRWANPAASYGITPKPNLADDPQ